MTKTPKLSQEMQDCLNWLKLNPGWHSSYGSPWSRKTLDALHKRGLVRRKSGLGAMFSPRTSIQYTFLPQ